MVDRRPKVIDVSQKEKKYFEGGGYDRTAISKEGEGVDITVHLGTIPPGKTHEFHSHEQDEIMYIVQGSGKYIFEDGKEIHYKAGDFFFMPKGTVHKNEVLSKEDMIIVPIFSPAQF